MRLPASQETQGHYYPIITRSGCLYHTKQNKSSVRAALLPAAGVGPDGVGPAGAAGPARLVVGADSWPWPGLGVGFPSPPGGIGPPPALCGGPVVLLWVLCGLGRLPGTSAGPHRAILAILYPRGSAHMTLVRSSTNPLKCL